MKSVLRICGTVVAIALSIQQTGALGQQPEPEIEILSKDDARTLFAMTRKEWNTNVRLAASAGHAKAMGQPESGYGMVTESPLGVLIVTPDFGGSDGNPDFIQVSTGFRPPLPAWFTEDVIGDIIQTTKDQMMPEYDVLGGFERGQEGAQIWFIITEHAR